MRSWRNGIDPDCIATETVLLKQYKLIGAVIDAPWATRLDHKIARHVIDRYFAKFGNARASLSYLEQATGAKRTNIVESLRRISDPRRQGRRPLSLLRSLPHLYGESKTASVGSV